MSFHKFHPLELQVSGPNVWPYYWFPFVFQQQTSISMYMYPDTSIFKKQIQEVLLNSIARFRGRGVDS